MKNKKYLYIIILIVISACSFNNNIKTGRYFVNQYENKKSKPLRIVNNSIFKTLIDDNCQFPCYLSLTPGKTTYNQAVSIAKNLSDATVLIKTNKIIIDWTWWEKSDINYKISVTVNFKNGIVSKIHSTQNIYSEKIYNRVLKDYFPNNILNSQGIPDLIFFDDNDSNNGLYKIKFYYKNINTIYYFNIFNDVHNDINHICFDKIKDISTISIEIVDIMDLNVMNENNDNILLNKLNITKSEFVEFYLNNNEVCIEYLYELRE